MNRVWKGRKNVESSWASKRNDISLLGACDVFSFGSGVGVLSVVSGFAYEQRCLRVSLCGCKVHVGERGRFVLREACRQHYLQRTFEETERG